MRRWQVVRHPLHHHYRQSLSVEQQLYDSETEHHRIQVFENGTFGRVMAFGWRTDGAGRDADLEALERYYAAAGIANDYYTPCVQLASCDVGGKLADAFCLSEFMKRGRYQLVRFFRAGLATVRQQFIRMQPLRPWRSQEVLKSEIDAMDSANSMRIVDRLISEAEPAVLAEQTFQRSSDITSVPELHLRMELELVNVIADPDAKGDAARCRALSGCRRGFPRALWAQSCHRGFSEDVSEIRHLAWQGLPDSRLGSTPREKPSSPVSSPEFTRFPRAGAKSSAL